ncbi:helix-turn-helix transcriptional regulator [Streptomyces cahuitamycinicus]|uniref:HTH luxR-type domain-containing protein n=1 Tax=Streptomyces cahuitamycinicus TaxID=2070367 RepID=A0A2N8TV98_9ACTN|nr:hypothetical protein C1J00_06705 [Streptomyces cahuitamycinicus]
MYAPGKSGGPRKGSRSARIPGPPPPEGLADHGRISATTGPPPAGRDDQLRRPAWRTDPGPRTAGPRTAGDADRTGRRRQDPARRSARRDSEEEAVRALGREAFERAHRRGGALGLPELAGHALQEPGRPPGAEAAAPPPHEDTTVRLTRRETEVARLVAEGLANQQIADRLVIARRTAEGHVERILGKLGFSNRSQIAAWMTAQR